MVRNNHCELDKCTLASQIKKTLDQSLSKKNINSGFKVTKIQPLNPKAMDEKIRPSETHITNATNIFEEYNDGLDGLANEQEEPKENGATTQLLNLAAIIQNVGIKNHDEHE